MLGRPRSVMTEPVIATILRAVEVGLPVERAAHAAGVDAATVRSHRKRHSEFATALEKAEATSALRLVTRIQTASEKQWQAAAWILERRWPNEWARRDPQLTESVQEIGSKIRDFLAAARIQDTAEGEVK